MAAMGIEPQSQEEIRQALVEDAPKGRRVLVLRCGAGETHVFGYVGDVERGAGKEYYVTVHQPMGRSYTMSAGPVRVPLTEIYRVVLDVDRDFDSDWQKAVGEMERYWLVRTAKGLLFGRISHIFSLSADGSAQTVVIEEWVSEPMYDGAEIRASKILGVVEARL